MKQTIENLHEKLFAAQRENLQLIEFASLIATLFSSRIDWDHIDLPESLSSLRPRSIVKPHPVISPRAEPAPLPKAPGDFAQPGQAHHSAASPAPQSVPSSHPCPQCGEKAAKLQERLLDLTPRASRLHGIASAAAKARGDDYVGVDHILIAIIRMDKGVGSHVLSTAGVTEAMIQTLLP